MMREKISYSFSRSLVKGQDHNFFKDLTGVFCTVGGTLVHMSILCYRTFLLVPKFVTLTLVVGLLVENLFLAMIHVTFHCF
jgi:hypothetical protein